MRQLNRFIKIALLICCALFPAGWTFAQSIASGTIEGMVVDSTGGVVVGAVVEMQNPLTGFKQSATTDGSGAFRFTNVPFNPYHLQVTQQGFSPAAQDVTVRTTVTIAVRITLAVANLQESVSVE